MWKKIVLGVVVVVLAIVGGVAWYLFSNLDSIVKSAIEKYGSAATLASVKVDSVKIALTSGQASLSGVTVGNPKGFATPHAITVGGVTVQIDTSSITGSGPIVIREIDINQPQVTYEVANSGGSNLQAIQKNTEAYAASMKSSGGSAPAPVPATSPSAGGPERKLIINDLYVRQGQVGVSATVLQGKALTVPLASIHLTNIGKGTDGATPAQVADQVLSAIINESVKAGSDALTQQVRSALGGAVTGTQQGAQGIGGQLKGLLGK